MSNKTDTPAIDPALSAVAVTIARVRMGDGLGALTTKSCNALDWAMARAVLEVLDFQPMPIDEGDEE